IRASSQPSTTASPPIPCHSKTAPMARAARASSSAAFHRSSSMTVSEDISSGIFPCCPARDLAAPDLLLVAARQCRFGFCIIRLDDARDKRVAYHVLGGEIAEADSLDARQYPFGVAEAGLHAARQIDLRAVAGDD